HVGTLITASTADPRTNVLGTEQVSISTAIGSPKVRLRGVTKQFTVKGRPIDALAGIDLDIRAGEFFCIVGPSGCGKTTLLRILAGLETQSAGTIEVIRDPGSERPLNSMVFQEQSVFPWMSVRDN